MSYRAKTAARCSRFPLTEDNGILKFTPRVLDGGNYNRLAFRLPASPDESVYGGGETFAEFDLRGKRQRVWVAEHINAGQIARKIIKSSLNIKTVDRKQRYSNYETYYAQPTFVSSKNILSTATQRTMPSLTFAKAVSRDKNKQRLPDLYRHCREL